MSRLDFDPSDDLIPGCPVWFDRLVPHAGMRGGRASLRKRPISEAGDGLSRVGADCGQIYIESSRSKMRRSKMTVGRRSVAESRPLMTALRPPARGVAHPVTSSPAAPVQSSAAVSRRRSAPEFIGLVRAEHVEGWRRQVDGEGFDALSALSAGVS